MTRSLKLIIPVKPLRVGKSRLGGVLAPAERRALNRRFLDHVLSVAAEFPGADRTTVVSRDKNVLDDAGRRGLGVVEESGSGDLNQALAEAIEAVDPAAECDILILPADLPSVTAEDLSALCRPPVAIAPDRRGVGTNGLFMATPHRITLSFGPDSLARHTADAHRLGLEPVIVDRPGLAFDVDTADDYDLLNGRGRG